MLNIIEHATTITETAIPLLVAKRMWTINHLKPSSVMAMINCCYARFWKERWFTNRQETLFIAWVYTYLVERFSNSMLQYHDKRLLWRETLQVSDILVRCWLERPCKQQANDFNEASKWSENSTLSECYQEAGGQEVLFRGHSVAGVHRNLSPMRYVVGHFLHVFACILLTRVQLFIDKPRPFAQTEIDESAHARIFIFRGFKVQATASLSGCGMDLTSADCLVAGRRSRCVGRDVVYEVRCLMHCILSRGTGIGYCWVPSHCGLHWNEISDTLTKQGAIKKNIKKTCLKYHTFTYYLYFYEISSVPGKTA